jgi:hypothetical protein
MERYPTGRLTLPINIFYKCWSFHGSVVKKPSGKWRHVNVKPVPKISKKHRDPLFFRQVGLPIRRHHAAEEVVSIFCYIRIAGWPKSVTRSMLVYILLYRKVCGQHLAYTWNDITFVCWRFHKIAKSDNSFRHDRLSVRPSAWNNSAYTGWIFINFDIWDFLGRGGFCRENSNFIKSDKTSGYFTWKRKDIYDNTSLNSS